MKGMDADTFLLKGNEAVAHAAVLYGCDGFFGYPITPQSEILETLASIKPWETTGMVVLQSESELASINMVYAGGSTGKCVMTSSSSPGVALMQEGISYMAACEVPGLIVSVQRGGPGLGTIQPSQSDYIQAVYGGGNGDYHVIVLAPASVQEMADMVGEAFELMFRWRMPVIMLSDGSIGQMMEKVRLPHQKPRRSDEDIRRDCPWAVNGLGLAGRKPNFMSSLELDPFVMEERNRRMSAKYEAISRSEARYEDSCCEDADILIVAYGISARVSRGAVDALREQGIRAGLMRPKTLWPFPQDHLRELAAKAKAVLVVELSEGQLYGDICRYVQGLAPVHLLSHSGGVRVTPAEVVKKIIEMMA